MKKLLSFLLLIITYTLSFSQCEAPLVINWQAEDDTNFNIQFVASENSESYIINFIALYDDGGGGAILDPILLSYTGSTTSGLNSITHDPTSLLTDVNINTLETYYYKVEIGTICGGETIWGNDFYMSRNSLLNDEGFECPENLFIPFTYLPDGQDEVYEVIFEVEEGDIPVQIDQLAVMLDIGHTFIGDLEITLTSPAGTSVLLLIQDSNLGGANDMSVLFQEGAEEIVTTQNEVNGVTVRGVYAPYESFDAFIGESLSGEWIITIADLWAADYGFVFGVCLSVDTSPCNSSISGTVYYDSNFNNTFDDGEFPMVNGMVNVVEDIYRFTDSDGDYLQCLPIGDHTVQLLTPPLYYTVSPESYTQSTIEGDYLEGFDFALQPIPGIYDLALELYHVSPDRPGFENTYYVSYTNVGTECIDDISLLFTANSEFVEIVSIESDDATTIDGSTFTSEIGTLCPNESGIFIITIYVSDDTEIGTLLNTTAVISPTEGDETFENNYGHDNSEVVGSFDPNDIMVNYEAINTEFLTDEDKLEYVIRFQNTGNYYAENVLVTNTIEEDLILTSIEILNSSHDVEVSIINGVAHFDFSNILLPASENDYEGSQGYVRYSINPTSSFSFNDVIENSAEIYFDFNEAIYTNTATTVLDETIGVSVFTNNAFSIYPNPSNGKVYIDSQFANQVYTYEVYNILGETIITNQFNTNEILIESLSEGLYTITLFDIDGAIIGSSKIVRK